MIYIETRLKTALKEGLKALYGLENLADKQLQINQTPKNFEGQLSVLVFPFVRAARKKPEQVAEEVGQYLLENCPEIAAFNVAKGFCNLEIADLYWQELLADLLSNPTYGQGAAKESEILVEYSSPNTNKPLHLGHVRNNLLGYSTAELLKFAGYSVKKVQIINDRGIHICKSMLAWQLFGEGETPESSGLKGDHLVGKYYVRFEQAFQAEYKTWQASEAGQAAFAQFLADEKKYKKAVKELTKKSKDKKTAPAEEALQAYFFKSVYKNSYFNQSSELGQKAKAMLQAWEAGNAEVQALWEKMNNWVYAGFASTYKRMGVDFDKNYYESNTYLKGKELVENNLKSDSPIFFKKDDGSTWIDLTDAKLDQKAVLRKDGTSMYITQDMGTALLRYEDYKMDRMVYVVGNEQEYHFQVLFEILNRLGQPYAKNCHHLSYGMVELPEGKMKSREGTVVDADDLMQTLIDEVAKASNERDMLSALPIEEQKEIHEAVALGALKFFILKVEPRKGMLFDPKESIDLQGQTGPYIQNAFVRCQSVQRAFADKNFSKVTYVEHKLAPIERELLLNIELFPNLVQRAAEQYNPAEIANYLYQLAKTYHQFWNIVKILDAEAPQASSFRLDLSQAVAQVIAQAGAILGMRMPSRM